MNVFSPRTTVQNEEAIVDLAGDARAVADCLIHGRSDASQLSLPLRAVAQGGYTPSNIGTTDFIAASTRIPIFSMRFCEALGPQLASEIEFIPCVIECQGQSIDCRAGRILKSLPLVDAGRSEYRKLVSGGSVLLRAVYLSSFSDDFLIARDSSSKPRFVVSERFKALCDERSMKIEFGTPV